MINRNEFINKGRTKVIESAGLSITAGLRKENPYKLPGCPYQNKCPIDPEADCSRTNVTYQLSCNNCEAQHETDKRHIYIGCTGTSFHARGMDHIGKANSDKPSKMTNSIAKHMEI